MAAAAETAVEQGLVPGVPGPAAGLRQLAEQVVGGQPGEQQRALEQFGLAKQHFTARVHGRRLLKKRAVYQSPLPIQPTTRRG